jgi:hypothetical protein
MKVGLAPFRANIAHARRDLHDRDDAFNTYRI